MARIDRCFNTEDFRLEARRRLPKWLFEFIDRGSEDEWGILHNREAFRRIKLRNSVLVDISGRDLGTTLFGRKIGLPVAIAPTGAAGLCWYDGEVALAKAAAKFGIPFAMATGSTTPLEKVADEAGGNLWFQLYLWENRKFSHDLMERARRAGYEGLLVTVDVALGVNREYNLRNGYGNPIRAGYPTIRDILLRPNWMTTVLFRYLLTSGMPRHANNPPEFKNQHGSVLRSKDSTVTWDDFKRLRDLWPGKLMIKGVQRPDDAARAVECGADGVIVSNHGARNMDSAIASIDALPAIAAAVRGKATVILDSGIRRGSDMVKAYALGADAVMLGRATLWGLAAGGQPGAERALDLLRREYEQHLAFVGRRSSREVTPDVLAPPRPAIDG